MTYNEKQRYEELKKKQGSLSIQAENLQKARWETDEALIAVHKVILYMENKMGAHDGDARMDSFMDEDGPIADGGSMSLRQQNIETFHRLRTEHFGFEVDRVGSKDVFSNGPIAEKSAVKVGNGRVVIIVIPSITDQEFSMLLVQAETELINLKNQRDYQRNSPNLFEAIYHF